MFTSIRRTMSAIVPVLAAVFIAFLAGATLVSLKLPPSAQISAAIDAAKALRKEGRAYLGIRPVEHLAPLVFDRTGPGRIDTDAMQPGVTFLVSIFDGQLTARLLDMDGSVLHQWPIDFFNQDDEAQYRFHALLHGAWLFPNGDMLVNLDPRGIYRVSACGEVIWSNRDKTHHSLFVDDAGEIWAPKHGAPFPAGKLSLVPFKLDYIGRFDPTDGTMLEEINLADPLESAGLEGLMRGNKQSPNDLAHVNDVEILSAEIADAFPLFDAGDILISPRQVNQIWVIDGTTRTMKWWFSGAFHGAHDPDFQPDGTITVFDNRRGGPGTPETNGLGLAGGSRIVKIDPVSRQFDVIYQSGPNSSFLYAVSGKASGFGQR